VCNLRSLRLQGRGLVLPSGGGHSDRGQASIDTDQGGGARVVIIAAGAWTAGLLAERLLLRLSVRCQVLHLSAARRLACDPSGEASLETLP
jgi:glycine/D-amino acid oxidase-like deaminating enzyme